MVTKPDPLADSPFICCAHCTVRLHPGSGDNYRITIEAVADPAPPVITQEELAKDARPQLEQLLEQLEGLSEREALDQIYRRLTLYLCIPCYRQWIEDPAG